MRQRLAHSKIELGRAAPGSPADSEPASIRSAAPLERLALPGTSPRPWRDAPPKKAPTAP